MFRCLIKCIVAYFMSLDATLSTYTPTEISVIKWTDSYGALSGWTSLEDYKPDELICVSCGVKVYENEKVVALAPNYANATTYTPLQANGLMVIPKSCILRITSFPYS